MKGAQVTLAARVTLAALTAIAQAAVVGCSSGPLPPARVERDASKAAAPILAMETGPASYVLTQDMGVLFDEAGASSTLPRPEPAIVDGTRMLIDGGVVLAKAPAAERLSGFRSLPKRLGGGYLLWSNERTYRAADFLGDLRPIIDTPASGGARPWLSSVLLRTERGILDIDPVSLVVRRRDATLSPGIADALAVDERRAVRVDAVGRASYTLDAGASWSDITEERGLLTVSLREAEGGATLVTPAGQTELRLVPGGGLELILGAAPPRRGRAYNPSFFIPPSLEATFSRSLAPESIAHAAAAGALLPGERALVARRGGLRLFSMRSARAIDDTDLRGVSEWLSHCQPWLGALQVSAPSETARNRSPGAAPLVDPDVVLACSHARGAHALSIDADPATPKLEATFFEPGGFVAGAGGRLAFMGRCGQSPPSADDFRRNSAPPAPPEGGTDGDMNGRMPGEMGEAQEPAPLEPPPDDGSSGPPPPSDDDARVCVRAQRGRWIERWISGADVDHLYRWVPGEDGTATAILLDDEGADAKSAADKSAAPKGRSAADAKSAASKGSNAPRAALKSSPGVRVIRVDADDPALEGGTFPAVLEPAKEPPFRSIDPDFRLAKDGSVEGWILLKPQDGSSEDPSGNGSSPDDGERGQRDGDGSSTRAKGARVLRVSDRPGGRVAGVRIAPDGRVTVFPLPPDTEQVVRGGPFALAMVVKDDTATYFETVDGGRAWRPVVGPPVGRLEPPSEPNVPFACSPIGCTLGGGLVRLGWNGLAPPEAKPSEPPAPPASPNPAAPSPQPPVLACRLATDVEPWRGAPDKGAPPPRPPRAKPAPAAPAAPAVPAGPISIRTRSSSPLGRYSDKSWSADVIAPFQPAARPRSATVRDPSIGVLYGQIAPILAASPSPASGLVDLLLLADKRRIRLGGASPVVLPFEYGGRVTVLADAADGSLVGLDADRGFVVIAREGPARSVLRIARAPDAAKTRLTLARRLDAAPGSLAVLGYSTTSGDVVVGSLDLGRAEIGPLRALGSLGSLAEAGSPECVAARPSHRFLADIPVLVRLTSKSGRELFETSYSATVLLAASTDRLCIEGLEIRLPQGRDTDLSVVFAPRGGASAAVRSGGSSERLSCSLERR